MKLFLISQDKNNGYDTYDSAVVCAESPAEAIKHSPSGNYDYEEKTNDNPYSKADEFIFANCDYGSWVKKEFVDIKYIGEAMEGSKSGVICSSFNAG